MLLALSELNCESMAISFERSVKHNPGQLNQTSFLLHLATASSPQLLPKQVFVDRDLFAFLGHRQLQLVSFILLVEKFIGLCCSMHHSQPPRQMISGAMLLVNTNKQFLPSNCCRNRLTSKRNKSFSTIAWLRTTSTWLSCCCAPVLSCSSAAICSVSLLFVAFAYTHVLTNTQQR